MLRVVELFSGIGTQSMALKRLGVEFETVAIAEIDKFAIQSYKAIHGEVLNLGDVSKVDVKDVPDHDLLTYSFPCQDISLAGKQRSLEEGSGTRSSLLWECRRIIEGKKPKYLLLENVKNLVGKKHKDYFDKWLEWLEEQGYSNYWQVINSKDYGVPQNRERVFVVSILNDDEGYEFPAKQELEIRLKDILEEQVEEKFYLRQEQVDKIIKSNFMQEKKRIQEKEYCDTLLARDYKDPKCVKVGFIESKYNEFEKENGFLPEKFNPYNKKEIKDIAPTQTTFCGSTTSSSTVLIKNATKKGYLEAHDGDGVDLAYPDSKTRRGRVQDQKSHTITTSDNLGVYNDFRIRKLTPLECWRLQGISDEDFYKAKYYTLEEKKKMIEDFKRLGKKYKGKRIMSDQERVERMSNSQLYKQAGNAITVDVLVAIFKQLFKEV